MSYFLNIWPSDNLTSWKLKWHFFPNVCRCHWSHHNQIDKNVVSNNANYNVDFLKDKEKKSTTHQMKMKASSSDPPTNTKGWRVCNWLTHFVAIDATVKTKDKRITNWNSMKQFKSDNNTHGWCSNRSKSYLTCYLSLFYDWLLDSD